MFKWFRVFSLGLSFVPGFVWGESIPKSTDFAFDSAKKSLELYLTAIHLDASDSESRKDKEANIHRGASGILHSFFHSAFADVNFADTKNRREFAQLMWIFFKQSLESDPEALDPTNVQIFLAELAVLKKEISERKIKPFYTTWRRAYFYSFVWVLSLEGGARSLVALKKKASAWSKIFRRSPRATADAVTLDDLTTTPSYSLKGVCRNILSKLKDAKVRRKVVSGAIRRLLIADVYSIPNYLFVYRPFFWGFRNQEPYQFSKELLAREVEPYFKKLDGRIHQ
jgi:hypothetical protein